MENDTMLGKQNRDGGSVDGGIRFSSIKNDNPCNVVFFSYNYYRYYDKWGLIPCGKIIIFI